MTRKPMTRHHWFPTLLLALIACAPVHAEIRRERIHFSGAERILHVFVPEEIKGAEPLPLLVLLHGSYQGGRDFLDSWTAAAGQQGLLLVAPESTDEIGWQIQVDGPDFIRTVVNSVARQRAVDCRRIYLFGISGGGVYALTLAMLESQHFAATAVFAAAWRESSFFELPAVARRKIPIGIFVGTRDPYFPRRAVQKTVDALEQAGHTVHLEWLKGRGHAYAPVSAEVNAEAWSFMQSFALDAAEGGETPDGCFADSAR
jgi:poly(3-hydroxybutyrate) depolymerase